MALYVAFRSTKNILHIVYNHSGRIVTLIAYIDCVTLLSKLMNETVPNILQIGHRCREHINASHIHSICLIPGATNPDDGMTNAKPNRILADSNRTNKLQISPKHVFMLQTSPFCYSTYIRPSSVTIPTNNYLSHSHHPPTVIFCNRSPILCVDPMCSQQLLIREKLLTVI